MALRCNRIIFLALLLVFLLSLNSFAPARAGSTLSDPQISYVFGGPVVFRARLQSDQPVREAFVMFRSQGETRTLVGPASVVDGYLEYIYDQTEQPLRAFARVDYWFQVTLLDGSQADSEVYSFLYEDNRFEWRMLSQEPFHVHWYEGDLDFAQGVLNVAQEGLKKANSILALPAPEEINIYVYASSEELQATRRLSRREGVAGHAEVDLGVMVVSLPNVPERRLETERQVPHELMHILLYQFIGPGYENIPTWLNEGLASVAELYPTPDYQVVLESAAARGSLLPVSQLCGRFPPEMSEFILAYAESAYFTRYLYRTYGSTRLETLLSGYANGLDCEHGFEAAFGLPLASVESQWLNQVFQEPAGASEPAAEVSELVSWFLLLFVVVALPFMMVLLALVKPGPAARVEVKGV